MKNIQINPYTILSRFFPYVNRKFGDSVGNSVPFSNSFIQNTAKSLDYLMFNNKQKIFSGVDFFRKG